MIECIIGSFIGTLLGLTGSYYIVRYQLKKDEKKWESDFKKLIEELTTFKIKFGDEI